MKNIIEMRDNLTALYADLKSGAIEPKLASEMNNTAGKIINTLKVELIYAEQRKARPSIAFLDNPESDKETAWVNAAGENVYQGAMTGWTVQTKE